MGCVGGGTTACAFGILSRMNTHPHTHQHSHTPNAGMKFFVTSKVRSGEVAMAFLRKVYEYYADFVLKVRIAAWRS